MKTIDKNIEAPAAKAKGRPSRYKEILEKMTPGDSMLIPTTSRFYVANMARAMGYEVVSKVTRNTDNTRIWRVG